VKDAVAMRDAKQLDPIAGVLVQRLIPSKLNDVWGFELLEGFVANVPTYVSLSFIGNGNEVLMHKRV
jgi:hypothetical protein